MLNENAEKKISGVLILLLLILTAYSMVVRVQLYSLEVTLWYDEALLSQNIISQNLGQLLTTPLNTGWGAQSAPLFFMAVVKIFTMIFGVSEMSVRVFSFVLCVFMLIFIYFLMRKSFKQSALISWFAVCLTSTLPLYVRYSNEMKPYMGDACFAVLVLALYYMYRTGRLKLFVLTILCVAIIFFSTPSVFFIAAVFIIEFLRNLKNKDYKIAMFILIAGVIAAAAFAFHYFFWLRSTATDAFMTDFWSDYHFRLPFSGEAIRKDLSFATEFLLPLGRLKYMILAFALAGYLISIVKRNIYSIVVGLSFVLLLAASTIGMYPIISRLWLFFFAFCLMYTVYFIAHIRIKFDKPNIEKILSPLIAIGFSAILLVGNASFTSFAKPGGTDYIYPGMNVNPLIAYVKENIKDGEYLYSFETATPVLWFKNGYGNERIGDVSEENIMLGTIDPLNDVNSIIAHKNVYLLYNRGYIPYSYDYRIASLNFTLAQSGFIDRVKDINNTPLYWFTTDITRLKTSAGIDVAEQDGKTFIMVQNTGETILETRESALDRAIPGGVILLGKFYKDGVLIEERELGELPEPLRPGEQAGIRLRIGDAGDSDKLLIDLVSEGRFDFSTIGMTKIEIPLM